jgi:glycine dehydrogenase subunit 2
MQLDALRRALGPDVAALMITIPNTLGLFDEHIEEIISLVHGAGALVYCDGANLNALLGQACLGELGVDVLHFNLHKTFSTPHGGGGPPAGPIGVTEALAPFLPIPLVGQRESGEFFLDYDRPLSIGKVKAFYGNFAMLVRAYIYIRSLGVEGIREVGANAVLNANYLLARLKDHYQVRYDRICKHEFVLSAKPLGKYGVRALDVAKRLIDHDFHPPTIYFPLIVEESMMIEPTETESIETLDGFAEAMIAIADEAARDPETVKTAPHSTETTRLDEVRAVRRPDLRWRPAVPAEH